MSHNKAIHGANPKIKDFAKSEPNRTKCLQSQCGCPLLVGQNWNDCLSGGCDLAERRFVRVIENRETGCFEGEFSFKLTGVVSNRPISWFH